MICTECEKECEHDQYHCWCNDCGRKIENEMILRDNAPRIDRISLLKG